mmetsp:Transcript_20141/g.49350  ORF Transcript_20141/g.49350 Transcript_20141/m.49350 type:complete len:287 (+) Transcript_20141:470-1330(+)|eukprot:CAMPEP_0198371494 /NCGR_PEP_ID=MMETSP1450-20131203/157256_1 /TAXON_ID=753684 ORGANISM="Madagascaria erythrocladiodes, Strain CCMP3234" /NCGR_SAMPLE_ID=MMETSP1450 /ASSEMBLY_ACC=CAM_ASM_001115 /LENGTH=286 /DNA_ID=CAMNT_0044079057 /DNA_START=561 /DNA_END=1421 /DNA_ORIENTATION=-
MSTYTFGVVVLGLLTVAFGSETPFKEHSLEVPDEVCVHSETHKSQADALKQSLLHAVGTNRHVAITLAKIFVSAYSENQAGSLCSTRASRKPFLDAIGAAERAGLLMSSHPYNENRTKVNTSERALTDDAALELQPTERLSCDALPAYGVTDCAEWQAYANTTQAHPDAAWCPGTCWGPHKPICSSLLCREILNWLGVEGIPLMWDCVEMFRCEGHTNDNLGWAEAKRPEWCLPEEKPWVCRWPDVWNDADWATHEEEFNKYFFPSEGTEPWDRFVYDSCPLCDSL